MHPNELAGRVKALLTRMFDGRVLAPLTRTTALSVERDNPNWNDDDDRDAGVLVRCGPRYPKNAGGIAVPEPDDDRLLNLTETQELRIHSQK